MSNEQTKIADFEEIYKYCVMTRELDALEMDYVKRGEAFFHVACSGHEGIAFLGPHLIADDYLHCHYRDKSLMLYRGVSAKQFFLSLFCKAESHSAGRQMSAHMAARELNLLSIVGPVGNSALQACGVAQTIKDQASHPIVYCGMGDGSSQEGEVFEALAQAVRLELPILFVVECNGLAISTKTTGATFFSRPNAFTGKLEKAETFYGIPLRYVNGCDPEGCYQIFGQIVSEMRQTRRPAIVILEVERLTNHTNVDDQTVYRSQVEIERNWQESDPIKYLEVWLSKHSSLDLKRIRTRIKDELLRDAEEAKFSVEPKAEFSAKIPISQVMLERPEFTGTVGDVTMIEAIREVLQNHLETDERVTLYGEDIADPKGDVFGVTRGLTKQFPKQVMNSPLSESTIAGFSVGRALAGERPVAFLQFADFLPIAFNQISSELASMYWRTAGKWQAPVIFMISTGGYKAGLGPFHASSMESTVAHVAGLDVLMPSTAGDAAGLLNAAFESGRPTIFFYPKSLLNDHGRATQGELRNYYVPLGKAAYRAVGKDISLVGWGNALPLLEKANRTLNEHGITCDVIDLRSISPWDEDSILESVRKTGKLLLASEENGTASMSSEICAVVAEKASNTLIKRVVKADTFVPCNFANQLEVLPSYRAVLEAAVKLLGGDIQFEKISLDNEEFLVEALGASPSDESVTVVEWFVKVGDTVNAGDEIADAEAEKAAFSVSSPIQGVVEKIFVAEGDSVKVGAPLLKIRPLGQKSWNYKPLTREPDYKIKISFQTKEQNKFSSTEVQTPQNTTQVKIVSVTSQVGSRLVSNQEICSLCPTWTPEDILRRTGITNRYWVSDNEDALSLVLSATEQLLQKTALELTDIDLLIVATGSPLVVTPSMACQVLAAFSDKQTTSKIAAFDINAACSGYLYGLRQCYDFLMGKPNGRALLLTTEALSRALDVTDSATAPIFGDAATATLLTNCDLTNGLFLKLERPVLGAKGDRNFILQIPRALDEKITMDGVKVFPEAVRNMLTYLKAACAEAELTLADLDLIIPHQANQRIINAIRQRTDLPEDKIYSLIAEYGNTSSSSIPLCLDKLWDSLKPNQNYAVCAFGGGFTFGGAVLRS